MAKGFSGHAEVRRSLDGWLEGAVLAKSGSETKQGRLLRTVVAPLDAHPLRGHLAAAEADFLNVWFVMPTHAPWRTLAESRMSYFFIRIVSFTTSV
mmetsp:Transcript_93404/g.264432  ORF Transcript_93404/g.264432 Transcript_93404/m.264432 type:complete len:96 (-) Transcript_93404:405-692(-)